LYARNRTPDQERAHLKPEEQDFITRFQPVVQEFLAPWTEGKRQLESNKATLRGKGLAEKVRLLSQEIEKEWVGASFDIRDETRYSERHGVFIRVRLNSNRCGFYLMLRGDDCLVCFFKDSPIGPGWSQRLRRTLLGSGDPYDNYYYSRQRLKRKQMKQLAYVSVYITDSDIFEWFKYICSDFDTCYTPAITSEMPRPEA